MSLILSAIIAGAGGAALGGWLARRRAAKAAAAAAKDDSKDPSKKEEDADEKKALAEVEAEVPTNKDESEPKLPEEKPKSSADQPFCLSGRFREYRR